MIALRSPWLSDARIFALEAQEFASD